jgi:hypothetical protein
MFKSTIRVALTLPALSALLVALSGQPAAASSRTLAPNLAPGQARVMTAAAASVVSSMHYQAELDLSCSNTTCAGDFPAPGPHRQLTVTRISCVLIGTASAAFRNGNVELVNLAGAHLLFEHLPVDYFDSSGGVHTLNRAVDVRVGSQQHVKIDLNLETGAAALADCTATGTLDTLQ